MVIVVAALLGSCESNAAAAGDEVSRLTFWAGAGPAWPSEDAVRDRYTTPGWPWLVQVDLRVAGPVCAFVGVRHESREGETLLEPPVVTDERFPLELTSTSVRFGAGAGGRLGIVDLVALVGAQWTSGTERWPDLGQSYDFAGWGLLLQGSMRVPLGWRLAAVGFVEFDHAPMAPAEPGASSVNLGGFALGAGVAVRF